MGINRVKVKVMRQAIEATSLVPYVEETVASIDEFSVLAVGEKEFALRGAMLQVDPNFTRWEKSPGVKLS